MIFDGLYKRGIAVGETDIRNDQMHFRFKDEIFSFTTPQAMKFAVYNGYFYEAKIKDVRKMARRKH